MINEKIEAPCKIEDILSFNFENLQKFLSFLQYNDTQLSSKIKNLNLKISEIDNFKCRLEEAEFKLNLTQNKFKEIDKTLNAHQLKLIDLDSKHSSSNNHIIKNETILNDFKLKTVSLEENVNNLNRMSEENTKSLRKMMDTNEEIRVQLDRNVIEIEKIKSDSISNLSKKYKNLESTCDKKFHDMTENFSKIYKKLESTEDSLLKIAEITSRGVDTSNPDINKNSTKIGYDPRSDNTPSPTFVPNQGSSHQINHINNNQINNNRNQQQPNSQSINNTSNNEQFNMNLITSEINKILSQIDWLTKENNSKKESIANLYKTTEEIFENMKHVKSFILHNNNSNIVAEQDDFNKKEKSSDDKSSSQIIYDFPLNAKRDSIFPFEDGEVINDNLEKLHDNLKIVSQNIHNRVTKDELERQNKVFKLEIEKINEKFSNQIKGLDGKLKQLLSTPTDNKNSFEGKIDKNTFSQIQEVVTRISKEVFEKEFANINLLNNDSFKQTENKLEEMKSELDKIFESLVDIRKTSVHRSKTLEDMVKDSNSRIVELEISTRDQCIKVDDILRVIEGDSYDSNKINYLDKSNNLASKQCLRDSIKNLNLSIKLLTERIEKLQSKQNNMNTEILAKVKKDLQFESNRILDDFKHDLRSSIYKIQDQLKEKVDRFNLDEFGKKIDNKMLIEISKKLDKNDLKKNNCVINKKIDTLENKISKTLVDTLIDLQVDEAPLIVKQSINGEKCASCNQFLQNAQHIHDVHLNNQESKNVTKSICHARNRNSTKSLVEGIDQNFKTVRISELPEINKYMNKTNSDFNHNQGRKSNNPKV